MSADTKGTKPSVEDDTKNASVKKLELARSPSEKAMVGHLTLVLGPMKADKTTIGFSMASVANSRGLKVIYINSAIDDREDSKSITTAGNISTHSSIKKVLPESIVSIKCKDISQFDISGYGFFVIDEAQFHNKIYDTVTKWVKSGKVGVCIGLNGDSEMGLFGEVYKLIPFADNLIFCRGKCEDCDREMLETHSVISNEGVPAPFTAVQKSIKKESQIMTGSDQYKTVCRYHYQLMNSTK